MSRLLTQKEINKTVKPIWDKHDDLSDEKFWKELYKVLCKSQDAKSISYDIEITDKWLDAAKALADMGVCSNPNLISEPELPRYAIKRSWEIGKLMRDKWKERSG